MPEVSVIMAAYNAERHIGDAILSVQLQTFDDWELLVVDDGSTDGTAQIVTAKAGEDSRIRLIQQPNSGSPAAARNAGIPIAAGQYLAFLDADDLYAPEKIQAAVAALKRHPEAGLVFHDIGTMDADGQIMRTAVLGSLDFMSDVKIGFASIENHCYEVVTGLAGFLMTDYVACHTSSVVLNPAALNMRAIRFREDVVVGEDLDLWLRAITKSRVLYIDQVLAQYRKHEGSVTGNLVRLFEDTITVLEARRHEVELSCCSEADVSNRIAARLSALHQELGYQLLLSGNNVKAGRTFLRGLWCYGGRRNAIGVCKSCLPWSLMRKWWLMFKKMKDGHQAG